MAKAGVPVVPGYHGDDQDLGHLAEEAERIGFPVLIKASAGGGGRGMRVVGGPAEFHPALEAARREAAGAFGDDRVLLEKYLERPRHIEVQVFADRHGDVVHIFDRDCSIQRRHQKVMEEAPAPGLDEEQRRRMGKAAVAAVQRGQLCRRRDGRIHRPRGRARGVLFHRDEHAASGRACGERGDHRARPRRMAVADGGRRAVAAAPAGSCRRAGTRSRRGFTPKTPNANFCRRPGTLHRLHLPSPDIARVDTGVRQGDAVTPFYDPMIAKIVVWGEDRAAAVGRLRRALGETAVLGLRTNLGFLARVAADPDFAAGAVDTGFIARRSAALLASRGPAPDAALAAAILTRLTARQTAATAAAARSGDPFSPWARNECWRLGGGGQQQVVLRDRAAEQTVKACTGGAGWMLRLGERAVAASGEIEPDGALALALDGVGRRVRVLDHGCEIAVFIDGESWRFEEIDPLAPPAADDPSAGKLTAPMPGRVMRLLVEPAAKVRRGEPLMVIEAMKMEHTITAPADGVVAAVRFAAGELVEEGAELIALAALDGDSA